jgi:hypothetical protein
MTKPSKPGKPIEKTTKAPRKSHVRRALRLTDEQLERCKAIAAKHSVFGVSIPPLAVADEALARGLECLEAE